MTGQGDQSVGHCPTMLLVRNKGTMKKTRMTGAYLVVPTLLVFPAPTCHMGTSKVRPLLNWLVVASRRQEWVDINRVS